MYSVFLSVAPLSSKFSDPNGLKNRRKLVFTPFDRSYGESLAAVLFVDNSDKS